MRTINRDSVDKAGQPAGAIGVNGRSTRLKAVILAGGRGTRLRPYTFVLPKPLVPVGEEPIIGLLLKQLRRHGIREVIVTLGYCSGIIRALLADSAYSDINIKCVEEKEPLGTVGALRLAQDEIGEDFLVTNGDIVSDIDIRALVKYHQTKGGIATIACHRRTTTVPYGVLKIDKHRKLVNFTEKPQRSELVNMGLYVFRPDVFRFIPSELPFGADDLLRALLDAREQVYTYIHRGMWADIGHVTSLIDAQADFDNYRERISGD